MQKGLSRTGGSYGCVPFAWRGPQGKETFCAELPLGQMNPLRRGVFRANRCALSRGATYGKRALASSGKRGKIARSGDQRVLWELKFGVMGPRWWQRVRREEVLYSAKLL